MLFQVEMTVRLPATMPANEAEALKRTEREVAQGLMRQGTWRHLWRVAGRYANLSVFDVDSVEQLHQLLSTLPLFPYMDIAVVPLCRHPSSIRDDDR